MSTQIEQFIAALSPAFEAHIHTLNGELAPQAKQAKLEALELAKSFPFPTRKLEEWKYTSLERLFREGFSLSKTSEKNDLSEQELWSMLPEFKKVAHKAVFVNGKFQATWSKLPEGVRVLVPGQTNELPADFGKVAKTDHFFVPLHQALWQEALVVEIAKNAESAFSIIHLTDTRQAQVFSQPRVFVHALPNSRVKITEVYVSLGEQLAWHNALTELIAEENAHLDYALLQADLPNVYHTGWTEGSVKKNGVITCHTHTINGGIVRNDLHLNLDSAHSQGNMNGLYLTHGQMHVDNHTVVDHKFPQTLSNELYKGILMEKSTGVFNGKIFVRQDAQQTNAFQSNRNLLLSEEASINTKPQLEIWADDVKCSHGATTGRLDDESLFYLKSRGLSEPTAKRMLLEAYAIELIERLPSEEAKSFIKRLLEKYI